MSQPHTSMDSTAASDGLLKHDTTTAIDTRNIDVGLLEKSKDNRHKWEKKHTTHTGIHPHALPNVNTGIRPSLFHARHFPRIKTLNETCQRNGNETNQMDCFGNISRDNKFITNFICVSRMYR